MQVSGSFRSFFLYDIAEEIDLKKLRELLGSPPEQRGPAFPHLAPDYVRFERPPVVESLPAQTLNTGESLCCQVSYHDYGVVSVELRLAFSFAWEKLVSQSAAWIANADMEQRAARIVSSVETRAQAALRKPHQMLSEDYYVLQLHPIPVKTGGTLGAHDLIAQFGPDIASMVRGEPVALSAEEQAEVLHSRMSYYPGDLLVVSWSAALVYDTPEGAGPTVQLLEYANSQLLGFRQYDRVLSDLLDHVYDLLSGETGFFSRWRMAREAERLSALRLDVQELTERVDNSIKFLSDTYSARTYRLAAARIGVPDYRKLVEEKLTTIGELYQLMMDRFHQGRAFVLELMVVVILVIELGFVFRGK